METRLALDISARRGIARVAEAVSRHGIMEKKKERRNNVRRRERCSDYVSYSLRKGRGHSSLDFSLADDRFVIFPVFLTNPKVVCS